MKSITLKKFIKILNIFVDNTNLNIQNNNGESCLYLLVKYKHWINTRYVNYWIYPNGCYLFNNPTKLIENKNMLSHLDSETMEPLFYKEVEENISLPYVPAISKGLEE